MSDNLSQDSMFLFKRMANDKAIDFQKPARADVHNAPSIIRGRVRAPPLAPPSRDLPKEKSKDRKEANDIREKIRNRGSEGLIRGKPGNAHSILERAMKTQRKRSSEKPSAPSGPSDDKPSAPSGPSDDKPKSDEKKPSLIDKNIQRRRSRSKSVTKEEDKNRDRDRGRTWRPSNYQRGGEDREKRECLMDLEKLKLQNINLTKNYTMDDDLVDMQYERDRHNMNMEMVQKMKISKGYVLLGCLGVVFFNMMVGNKLMLEGWLEAINNELESGNYNIALEQIYHMFHKRGPPSPFWSLGLLCVTSVVCTHFSNKMGVSIKGYGKDGDKAKGESSGGGGGGIFGGGLGNIMGALSGFMGGGNKGPSASIPPQERSSGSGSSGTRRPIRPPSSKG